MEIDNKIEVSQETLLAELTDQQRLWADAYLKVLNKRQATLMCNLSSPNGATQYGTKMYNIPAVKAYIEFMLLQYIGEPDENIKLLRSIADTDLNNYLTKVKRPKRDMIEVRVKHIIKDLEFKLSTEEDWMLDQAVSQLEITRAMKNISAIKRDIFNLKAELKRNPYAKRIMPGPEYLATEMVLDLVKVHADKEQGRIKKLKHNKDGSMEIEMYDAKDAAVELLKIAGKYKNTGEGDEKKKLTVNFDEATVVYE